MKDEEVINRWDCSLLVARDEKNASRAFWKLVRNASESSFKPLLRG